VGGKALLEAPNANTENNQTNGETTKSALGVCNNWRQRRDNQDDMTQERKNNGELDSLESAKELITNPGAHQWSHVAPECVDYTPELLTFAIIGENTHKW